MGICNSNCENRQIINEIDPGLAPSVLTNIIESASKTICKICLENQNFSITGFFLDIYESLFLITNYHFISQNILNINPIIEIENNSGKKIEFKINKNKRYIKLYENFDITVIQILNSDGINKYFEALNCDYNYINNFPKVVNADIKNIFSLHYPEITEKMKVSAGKITKIIDYKFIHTLDSEDGSFGCPIILSSNSRVIGINILNKQDEKQNYGVFIGVILDDIKTYLKSEVPSKDITLSNFNNNLIINDKNDKNFIIAEIFIDNININKDLLIINSYEERMKRLNKNKEKIDYIYKNEKEIKECEIKINDENINFSYFYNFKKKGKNKITYIFKKKLTNISFMFSGCSFLTSIDLSNFITDDVNYMRGLFLECSSLININLSNLNTLDNYDMGFMFSDCDSLNNIDLSGINTQNVIFMENLFNNCKSLRNLNLSNFNTKNVKYMNYMFSSCLLLENLDLSSFNTKNVIKMNHMFFQCSSLKYLDLSKFDTIKVKKLNNMFGFCYSLIKLDLSNFNTPNVIDMSGMFSVCSSLKDLNISNFKIKKETNIENMFEGCVSLKKDYINNTIQKLMNN